MAELVRYTPVALADPETFLQLGNSENIPESEGLNCKKCSYIKPLRTHHCSVCNTCVLLMDHHCMWTNNCIGLHNHKQFLQLCGFAQIACFYTAFLIWSCEEQEWFLKHRLSLLFTFAKFWDLLVGKAMMAFFGWNLYVASTGLTYIEFKNAMELTHAKAKADTEPAGDAEAQSQPRRLMKFNYGFGFWFENLVRVFKTANPLTVFFFTDWGEDPKL
jgi:hypothetical protein